jgi:hypothetical protein
MRLHFEKDGKRLITRRYFAGSDGEYGMEPGTEER